MNRERHQRIQILFFFFFLCRVFFSFFLSVLFVLNGIRHKTLLFRVIRDSFQFCFNSSPDFHFAREIKTKAIYPERKAITKFNAKSQIQRKNTEDERNSDRRKWVWEVKEEKGGMKPRICSVATNAKKKKGKEKRRWDRKEQELEREKPVSSRVTLSQETRHREKNLDFFLSSQSSLSLSFFPSLVSTDLKKTLKW